MKITVFLLLVSVAGVLAGKSYSQTKILTLNIREATVKEVLKSIEKQSEFYFLYSEDLIDAERKVNVNIENNKIEEALNQIFKGTDVNYSIRDRIIVLTTPEVLNGELEVVQQQKAVSGKVTDEAGEPLPGVTVVVKGSIQGTVTNADGNYSITNIPENATLVFSFVGMQIQEIEVGDQTTIDVTMVVDAIGIEEVVAIGYGTQIKDVLTGSITQINPSDFNKRPITNTGQVLQGVASGVYVSQLSGEPGQDNTQIRIRGEASFSGSNEALVLVDGIESSINAVNPDDIESISVLKDASSTSIYGSRAANGVILVTTKRGKNERGHLNIDVYSGLQTAVSLPQQVSDPLTFIDVHNKAFKVPLTGDLNGRIGAPYLSDAALEKYKAYLDETGFKGTNWFDEIFRTAPITRMNISAIGGAENIKYYASAFLLDQEGITIGTSSKQGGIRLNLDAQLTDKIKIGTTINGKYSQNLRPNYNAGGSQVFLAYRRHPTVPAQLENGLWTGNKFEQGGFGSDWDNPVALAYETRNTSKQLMTSGNMYIEFEPIKNLKFNGLASGNMTNIDVAGVNNSYDYWRVLNYWQDGSLVRAGGNYNNSLSKSHSTDFNTLLQVTINYTFELSEKHNFDILGGYSEELIKDEILSGGTSQFNQVGIEVIGDLNPENETAGGSASHIAFRSYFGRLNYDYLSKYLFSASFRADATSRFAPENRWGYFPSFAAGWVLSKEDFFPVDVINFLKVRGSWGEVGNQSVGGLYLYQSSIAQNAGLSYVFDNGQALGAGPTSFSNRDAKWETAVKTDIAIDGRLLKNKLNFGFNYFWETRNDQLLSFPVPDLAGGLESPIVNLASVNVWGWELELGYSQKFGDFTFSFSGNLSHAENKVTKITEGVDRILRGTANTQLIQVGYPIDQPFLIVADGLYKTHEEAQAGPLTDAKRNQTAGDIKYIDQNNDGVISQQNSADDKVPVGKPYPQLVYGFNTDLKYKDWDLAVQANGVAGVDYWLSYHGIQPFTSQGGIPKRYMEESVSFNPNGTLPRVVFQGNYLGNEGLRFPSTFDLYSGDYLRIKNIQLGYSLPDHLVSKIGLAKLRIYANAANPFVLTKLIDGIDPERPLGNSGSLEVDRIPVARVISAGINITF